MPFLRFRAVETEKIASISKCLVDELQRLIGCQRDAFSLEAVHSTFIKDGDVIEGTPFVEVTWFDKGPDVQNSFVEILTENLSKVDIKNFRVLFYPLDEKSYYKKL
jgi:Domain of unknown function (DUF1904).